MVLLISGRHVGVHLDGHQHGVSVQISINLGKKGSPHISLKKNRCDLWILIGVCIFTFFLFILSFDFYFDLFCMAWLWKKLRLNFSLRSSFMTTTITTKKFPVALKSNEYILSSYIIKILSHVKVNIFSLPDRKRKDQSWETCTVTKHSILGLYCHAMEN